MNLAPHTQALMLLMLYGEASEAERAEWAALSTENPALAQEYKRLKATMTIINEAQKTDDEEDVFFAAQWEELRKVMKPNDNAPILIALPQADIHQRTPRANILRLAAAAPRWYWAAATILVAVGLSFNAYRWQMSELKNSSVQNTVQESEAAPSPNNNEPSGGASLSGKTDALQSRDIQSGDIQSRERQTKDVGNVSSAGRRGGEQVQGLKRLAQPEEQKPSVAPLSLPQNKTSSEQVQPSDDVKNNPVKENAAKENAVKDKVTSPIEEKKETTKSFERKKSDEGRAEESLQQQNKQAVEAEATIQKQDAPKLSAPKLVAPQGFDGIERFQSAPARATPQNAPSALPTSAKPASIQSSAKSKLVSTNATIRLDSAQKRDSSNHKK